MTTTAVMQPYFFPYIGYFQLIYACDTFVLLDDVNFIQKGWINRNNILLNGQAHLFTIPLDKPSQNKLILETKLKFDSVARQKFLKTIQAAYKKAPQFDAFYPVFENIVLFDDDDLTNYLENSFRKVFDYLGIEKKFMRSSQVEKDDSLKAQDRIIAICKALNTTRYINLMGGRDLYSTDDFSKESMQLNFIQAQLGQCNYKQLSKNFVPGLSFIDILMFNDVSAIGVLLQNYKLV